MSRLRVAAMAVILTTTAGSLLSACGGGDSSSSSGAVHVTYLVEASGAGASMGSQGKAGVKVALDEINSTHYLGDGVKLNISTEDTGGDPARAIAAATRAIKNKATVAVMCCLFSNSVAAVTPAAEKAGMPVITTGAIGADLTKSSVVYRGAPLIGPATEQLVAQTVTAFSPSSAVVVYTQDNEGMVGDQEVASKAFADAGVPVSAVGVASADTDFSGPATQVVSKHPDEVLVDLLGNANAAMVKELRDRGFKGKIMANTVTAAADEWNTAGQALTGTIMPVAFNPSATSDAVVNFMKLWQQANPKTQVDQIAANAYVSTWLVARAIKNAGSNPTRESVLKALGKLGTFDTITGRLKYEGGREPERTDRFDFVQWKADGKLVTWDGSESGSLG